MILGRGAQQSNNLMNNYENMNKSIITGFINNGDDDDEDDDDISQFGGPDSDIGSCFVLNEEDQEEVKGNPNRMESQIEFLNQNG